MTPVATVMMLLHIPPRTLAAETEQQSRRSRSALSSSPSMYLQATRGDRWISPAVAVRAAQD